MKTIKMVGLVAFMAAMIIATPATTFAQPLTNSQRNEEIDPIDLVWDFADADIHSTDREGADSGDLAAGAGSDRNTRSDSDDDNDGVADMDDPSATAPSPGETEHD